MARDPDEHPLHPKFRRVRGHWRAIERRARQDDGVLATAWLVGELGLSRQTVTLAIQDGLLFRVHRGVVSTHRRLTDRGRLRAGLITTGAQAVLGGRAGTAAHGLLPLGDRVDVLVPAGGRSRQGVRIREVAVDPRDVTGRHRMRVLTVPRLALDCAHEPWIDDLLHEAEVRRMLDVVAMEEVLERHRGRPNTRALRAALERRDPSRGRTRSELERAAARFLRRHGFPPHERGVLFELEDGRAIERDIVWREQRVVLELDGRAAHDTARAFEKDRRDDALLLAQGVLTVRATFTRLHAGEAELAGVLRRVLSPRAPDGSPARSATARAR